MEDAPPGSEVVVVLCDDEEIAAYHERYMGLPGPTDVLSWPSDISLGDVMVSCETAGRQAKMLGHSWEREVCVLAVHGTLHLLGWDDHGADEQAAMQARVDFVVDTAFGAAPPEHDTNSAGGAG
jgi:probable rRNA maturation factor